MFNIAKILLPIQYLPPLDLLGILTGPPHLHQKSLFSLNDRTNWDHINRDNVSGFDRCSVTYHFKTATLNQNISSFAFPMLSMEDCCCFHSSASHDSSWYSLTLYDRKHLMTELFKSIKPHQITMKMNCRLLRQSQTEYWLKCNKSGCQQGRKIEWLAHQLPHIWLL